MNFSSCQYITKLPNLLSAAPNIKELNLRECQKLGIRSVTILDTDCDPSLADLFIPANDDSVASLKLLLNQFLEDIQKGQKQFKEKKNQKQDLKKKTKNKI